MNAPVTTPELPTTAAPIAAEAPLEEEAVSDGIDWESVGAEENEDAEETAVIAQTETIAAETPEKVVAPVTPTAPTAPVVPVVTPETPPVTAPVAPVAPVVTPPKEETPPLDLAAEEARIQGELEQAYAMTEEDALAFQTEPELILPKLAAKLHRQIALDVMAGVKSVMPQVIQHMNALTTAETKARSMFYEANPDLNDPKLEDAVIQCGKMFRSVNKDAPPEQAVVLIGNMVRQALGMASPVVQPPAESVTAPAAPQLKPVPFSPTRGGSGAGVVAKPLSEWEQLAIDDD